MENNKGKDNALLRYHLKCTEGSKKISEFEKSAAYGTLQIFVAKHLPDKKQERDIVSQKVIEYVEYLSNGNKEKAVQVLGAIAGLPASIASEHFRKKIYRRRYKTKHERVSREKKGRDTIIDRHEQKDIRILKEMLRHGITYYDPGADRPSRSLQSLRSFIYNIYCVCKDERKKFDICRRISLILSILGLDKRYGLNVGAKNLQGILDRTLKNLSA